VADAPLLSLSAVSKTYPATDGSAEAAVLKDVYLELATGEAIAVVGPSGSGKSTLLNVIGTLDRPSAGKIQFRGEDLASLSDRDLATLRSRQIGLVFQLHHLLPQCTVLENVLVPTLAAGKFDRRESVDTRAKRLLERVGLSHRLDHRPGQLSGGERQRVALVRALINEPALLLADEPTGALDRAAADNLADLLVELNREEVVAMIVSTHSPTLAARMEKTYEIADGALSRSKSPASAHA
jgi:ABC-type lipoprotein export system ATPase subunit